MDSKVFTEVLLQHFLKLADDTVPNIRMMLGRTLNKAPEWLVALPEVEGVISKLSQDSDKDVMEAYRGGNVENADVEGTEADAGEGVGMEAEEAGKGAAQAAEGGARGGGEEPAADADAGGAGVLAEGIGTGSF
jgi:hypothetical protein